MLVTSAAAADHRPDTDVARIAQAMRELAGQLAATDAALGDLASAISANDELPADSIGGVPGGDALDAPGAPEAPAPVARHLVAVQDPDAQ